MSKLIQAIFAFVSALWIKGKQFIEQHAEVAVEFVQKVKIMLDSPAADYIVKILPGVADDKALNWLRSVLPNVLKSLSVIKPDDNDEDVIKLLQDLVQFINNLPEGQRGGFYRDLASSIAIEKAKFEDFKHMEAITRSRANLAVELQYLKLTDEQDD